FLLIAFYCVRPRDYYTGTDNVEAGTYVAQASSGEPVCIPGLELPGTAASLRLQLISRTAARPPLRMTLRIGGRTITSALGAVGVGPTRVSAAIFPLPQIPSRPSVEPAALCVR